MKRLLLIIFTVLLCFCMSSVCMAQGEAGAELGDGEITELEAYITERIAPVVAGVLTSIVALITVLRSIVKCLKSLKDTKDTFVTEAKERASAFRNNTELLTSSAQEIKKTVESVPTIEEQMVQLKAEVTTLIQECNVLAQIMSLGFSSNSEVVKSGKGKKMAQLLEKSKDFSSSNEINSSSEFVK